VVTSEWWVESGISQPLTTLFSQTQPTDYRQVPTPVLIAQVVQQAGPLAHHHQQAAPAGVVLLVRPQMLRELRNPGREQRDLHLRGTRVGGFPAEFIDDFGFAVLGNHAISILATSGAHFSCLN